MSQADDPQQDPIAYFLQDIAYQGKSERTQAAYERVLRDFEKFLEDGTDRTTTAQTLDSASHRDCMAYIHGLRGAVAESTVATYASYLHRFYGYMTQVGTFESNPMALVVEEIDESIDTDPQRRDISVPGMRSFVDRLAHPLDRAIVVTLLKTGIRAGELCNLDQRDLNLTDDPRDGMTVRPQLDGRPDSLYVSATPSRGSQTNGEHRRASNKRQRDTVIPVDPELRDVLVKWLAVRPDPVSEAKPLFTGTSDNWGRRITTDMVHHTVEAHARDVGWYHDGAGAADNVTPHYFRHFFTTHLRDRTGDRGIVKYLRGDVAQDIIDTYTHDWGSRVRDVYEQHIYQLL
ncbi:tyrosine-type recombinase/integrase [Halapricum hydrolyticum]|uniref:Tyrosine-type recombinase/integrase n=1 Tax=Halapricum hydrolyticum TaxID=2979991 RepID=A0AAE3IBG1_9EURY|nr:tyrosine-type recombinase/integrase [Halapricum hydrolyticum]MCU4717912.1 tyrosine-type recombinase/integrase [Halapricum hydrolyticum]MCU4727077.1 tyrosine-type recombinase/integrase [Halapricum hydrolyticum]